MPHVYVNNHASLSRQSIYTCTISLAALQSIERTRVWLFLCLTCRMFASKCERRYKSVASGWSLKRNASILINVRHMGMSRWQSTYIRAPKLLIFYKPVRV